MLIIGYSALILHFWTTYDINLSVFKFYVLMQYARNFTSYFEN